MPKLSLKEISVYYLNIDSRDKQRKHIEKDLTEHGFSFTRVEGIKAKNPSTSAYIGYAKAIYKHITSEFKPFILLEDDATIKENSDFIIEYPEGTDCIYLGMSAGADPNTFYDGIGLIAKRNKEYPRLYRIFNMLSGHAICILTMKYAIAYLSSLVEAAKSGLCADVCAVRLFPYFDVYAVEVPIFYQAQEVGGNQIATDITLKGLKDTHLTNDGLKNLYSNTKTFTQLLFE